VSRPVDRTAAVVRVLTDDSGVGRLRVARESAESRWVVMRLVSMAVFCSDF
jgi:hypothetical protein